MDFARPLQTTESIAQRAKIRYIRPNDREYKDKDKQIEKEDGDELDDMVIQAANNAAMELLVKRHVHDRESLLNDRPRKRKRTWKQLKGQDNDNGKETASASAKEDATDTSKDELRKIPSHLEPYIDSTLFPEWYQQRHVKNNTDERTIQPGDLVVIVESFHQMSFVYAQPDEVFHNRHGHFHHNDFINKLPFGSQLRSRTHQGYGFVYLLKPTVELWTKSLFHRTQIVQELDQTQVVFQLHLRPNMVVIDTGTGSGAMCHALCRTIAPHGHVHTFEFNEKRAKQAKEEFIKNGLSPHLVTVYHQDVCSHGFDNAVARHSVDGVFLDLPEPWLAIPHAAKALKHYTGRIATYSPCIEQSQRSVQELTKCGFHSLTTLEFRLQEHYVDEMKFEPIPREARPPYQEPTHHPQTATHTHLVQSTTVTVDRSEDKETTNTEGRTKKDDESESMVVARPFTMMRGHTAFLTFATAGGMSK